MQSKYMRKGIPCIFCICYVNSNISNPDKVARCSLMKKKDWIYNQRDDMLLEIMNDEIIDNDDDSFSLKLIFLLKK